MIVGDWWVGSVRIVVIAVFQITVTNLGRFRLARPGFVNEPPQRVNRVDRGRRLPEVLAYGLRRPPEDRIAISDSKIGDLSVVRRQ